MGYSEVSIFRETLQIANKVERGRKVVGNRGIKTTGLLEEMVTIHKWADSGKAWSTGGLD